MVGIYTILEDPFQEDSLSITRRNIVITSITPMFGILLLEDSEISQNILKTSTTACCL